MKSFMSGGKKDGSKEKRKSGWVRGRNKRKKGKKTEDEKLMFAAQLLQAGNILSEENVAVIVEAVKQGGEKGLSLFHQALAQFNNARDMMHRTHILTEVLHPVTLADVFDYGTVKEVARGQEILLDCWDSVLDAVDDMVDAKDVTVSYRTVFQVMSRHEFDIFLPGREGDLLVTDKKDTLQVRVISIGEIFFDL